MSERLEWESGPASDSMTRPGPGLARQLRPKAALATRPGGSPPRGRQPERRPSRLALRAPPGSICGHRGGIRPRENSTSLSSRGHGGLARALNSVQLELSNEPPHHGAPPPKSQDGILLVVTTSNRPNNLLLLKHITMAPVRALEGQKHLPIAITRHRCRAGLSLIISLY